MPSIHELAGQIICPVLPPTAAAAAAPLLADLQQQGWGGYIVFRGRPDLPELLSLLQAESPHPLLIASDIEAGAGQQLWNATRLPYNMAFGAIGSEDVAYEAGRLTAQEARAQGVNWAFAPVVDVNNNPDNPIVNIRSFGEDPEEVSRLAAAWVRGAQEHGLLATAKHFPGHGRTTIDSHLHLPTVTATLAQLSAVELAPFRACIAADVGAIMTAHLAVPALDPSGSPATLSHTIMTTLLREELNFHGLIVTDALIMGGITDSYSEEAAVAAAINAGCDVLLMPRDPKLAKALICQAVDAGKIPEARLREAVERIRKARRHLGLERDRLPRKLTPEDRMDQRAFASKVAQQSLTLVHGERYLPLPDEVFVMVVDDGLEVHAALLQELAERKKSWAVARPGMPEQQIRDLSEKASTAAAVVVA
ncbi:MAG: hypothetical protein HY692_05230, partial [Cyanobacteria bacterium NC_groundwater_1444_Ag_S-0.65um_54_12]|nr:hypothetical protein [Cyanobacteria bacterium NC_groundwater_1444_Ag_S-0.65um_54_12]